jgi:hypothetical protein
MLMGILLSVVHVGKIGGPYVFTARRDTLLLKTELPQKLYPLCLRNESKLHCNELKEINQ